MDQASVQQLPLDLPSEPSYAAEDYIAGEANADARLMVAELQWPTSVATVIGEPGSGKTHLAHVAMAELGSALWLDPDQSGVPDLSQRPAVMIIDGLEQWFGVDEDRVFHALEAARAAQIPVLVTAREKPESAPIKRPDTLSRLRAGVRAEIDAPDDRLFTAIAIKLFSDRQLMVDPDIASYLFVRMERSYATLSRLVSLIDAQSLAAGRSITKALARDVLVQLDMSNA